MRPVNADEKTLLSEKRVKEGNCPAEGQFAAKIRLVERGAVDLEAGFLEPAAQCVDGA